MKPRHQAMILVGVILTAVTGLSQEQKPSANQIKTAPSRASEQRNLAEAIDKLARTNVVGTADNRQPAHIDTRAKELADSGMELFYRKNRLQEGIEKFEAALKIDPRIPDAYQALASYHGFSKRDPETAVRYLEDGIKHCPKSSLLHANLGHFYSQTGHPTKAIVQFEAALDLGAEPKASVLYNIGNAYIKLQKETEAIDYYRKALAVEEKHLNARKNLAITYEQIGNLKEAQAEAQRLQELDPNGQVGSWAKEKLRQLDSR